MIVSGNQCGMIIELENIKEIKSMWCILNASDGKLDKSFDDFGVEHDTDLTFDMFDVFDDAVVDAGIASNDYNDDKDFF